MITPSFEREWDVITDRPKLRVGSFVYAVGDSTNEEFVVNVFRPQLRRFNHHTTQLMAGVNELNTEGFV